MFDLITQIVILITGALGIFLVTGPHDRWHKWGCLIGFIGQPFWLYTTFAHEQWGMLILSIWYTYCWVQGIWNYWKRG